MDTNNGVEAQNKVLKYKYLPKRKTNITLSYITSLLVDEVLPDMYQKYLFENYQMSSNYRTYKNIVPEFLQDRPRNLILHCLERKQKSRKFCESDIQCTDEKSGMFNVMGTTTYHIDFGVKSGKPSCTCKDWTRFNIPCKHFFAVFNHSTSWKWTSLPQCYLNSEYLSLDTKALGSMWTNTQLDVRQPDNTDMEDVSAVHVQPLRKKEVR